MPDPIVRLTAEAAAFVAGGGRDVDTAKLELGGAKPGAHVRLEDDRGDELGLAVFDPDNDRLRVLATPADAFPSIGGALLGWRVDRALRLRKALGLVEPGATYRLLHGAGDGVPGFTCDVLGEVGVLYAYAPALLPLARQLAEAVMGFAQLRGVCIKVRARRVPASEASGIGKDQVPQEFLGDVPDTLIAREHGVPFEIHPRGGLNVGLFTDMREHRRGLARFAGGRRVLNLFSYTGALSVACARAGAATVTSVDTSPGVAAWAQTNFALSELRDAKKYRFETGDAVRFLARAAKDRETYELVLIDPPTFSTARGAPWALDKDYPDLIAQAAAQLVDGGLLWLAANTHELGSLVRLAARGFRKANRTAALLETGSLPPDYPTSPVQLRDRYLQVALFAITS